MKKITYISLLFLVIFITGCKKIDKEKKNYVLNFYKRGHVTFGSYPQSSENNNEIIDKLNNTNKTWSNKEYYVNGSLESILEFSDIDLDNNGTFDYRAIKYKKYRPSNTNYESNETLSNQDDNGYKINEIYYFKYEPLKWFISKIIEKDDSADYLLISDYIIDSMEYYPSDLETEFKHNEKNGYANNYELSYIRNWLNIEFYNMSFNDLEKRIIISSKVNNDGKVLEEETNPYRSNDTKDKVYLLSVEEAKVHYTLESLRQKMGTDYAKSNGLSTSANGNSNYWLRTPSIKKSNSVYYVDYDGAIHGDGVTFVNNTSNTYNGVAPIIWINLYK